MIRLLMGLAAGKWCVYERGGLEEGEQNFDAAVDVDGSLPHPYSAHYKPGAPCREMRETMTSYNRIRSPRMRQPTAIPSGCRTGQSRKNLTIGNWQRRIPMSGRPW